jgi:metal iron transporter
MGMDLAQMNCAFLPRWLNIGLWLMVEALIAYIDISQVYSRFIPVGWFIGVLYFVLYFDP